MAKRSRVAYRQPRMSGPASDCLVIKDGEVVGTFTPTPRPPKRTSVVTLPNGELIVRISDL